MAVGEGQRLRSLIAPQRVSRVMFAGRRAGKCRLAALPGTEDVETKGRPVTGYDGLVGELLDRYGRTYSEEAGIRLADKPSPLYQHCRRTCTAFPD